MSKRLLPSDEELVKLYVKERKSCKEICRMFGLKSGSSSDVSKILKRLGVEIRKDAVENHHGWKGRRIVKGDGYYGIWNPKHCRADNQGYVYEHTLVYEKNTGYLPKKGEVIHHIDIDKLNNDFSNLYLCGNKEHLEIHRSIEKLIKPLLEKKIIGFKKGGYYVIDSEVQHDSRL